jgi:hypothetical protein
MPCYYFLALTVRPDFTAIGKNKHMSTQTSDPAPEAEEQPPDLLDCDSDDEDHEPPALIYAALLGAKHEAPQAIKALLAQINNDHANFPNEIIFRLHSDKGLEFMNEELNDYCLKHGIHKTSTAGYDPNANPAETTVGLLKARARFLLSGSRLPTSWWGLAILAAAHLFRCDAGL